MIILRVVLHTSHEKHKELKQALLSMISDIRRETSCSKANAYLNLENENHLVMLSHWESREELNAYLRSDKFGALLGTRILLSSPLLVFIDKVAMREGIEAVMALRGSG
jgi:quinol monooxygenase YgiN